MVRASGVRFGASSELTGGGHQHPFGKPAAEEVIAEGSERVAQLAHLLGVAPPLTGMGIKRSPRNMDDPDARIQRDKIMGKSESLGQVSVRVAPAFGVRIGKSTEAAEQRKTRRQSGASLSEQIAINEL